MGWEPTTYCQLCEEPFDVYRAEEDRICECCQEDLGCLDLEDQLDALLNIKPDRG
jgi:hypothetical protein